MNRRDFLKIVGITTATSTAALYGCGSKEGSSEGSKVGTVVKRIKLYNELIANVI